MNNVDNLITFVIPSIGRQTLQRTLESLLAQTEPNWNAYVGFDGLSEKDIKFIYPKDDRIKYFYFSEKLGESKDEDKTKIHSKAGLVRNKIISVCNSEWIAFLDDDDSITNDYVLNFKNELLNSTFDCYVYKMIDKQGTIIPRPYNNILYPGNIGISFLVNLNFIKNNSIIFESSQLEDYEFIKSLYLKKAKIKISNNIAYKVGH